MGFTKEDFTKENAQRLTVITNKRMGNPLLSSFFSLPPSQRTKFNRLLNEYIKSLGEDWETTLMTDFNTIVSEDILTEEFAPAKTAVPMVNSERTLLLTEEQQALVEEGVIIL